MGGHGTPLLVQSDDDVVRYSWFTWRLEIGD